VSITVPDLCAAVAALCDGKLAARVVGSASTALERVAGLDAAQAADLAFLANPRYRQQALRTAAGALILAPAHAAELFPDGRTPGALIICDAPYAWFAFAAQVLAPGAAVEAGCSPRAAIAADARIDPAARIDDLAVIGEGAAVGAGAWIGAGCSVGAGAHIGAGTRLHPGVRVYPGCRIGARGIVHAGAVIGADGFGFAPFQGGWVKIPQTGIVDIGDDVEIGANSTIDRGSAGDTSIGDGVKIDNQVQIGHNCRIGAHTAIAGCVGIAGSAVIGRHCQLGGAAMIHGHLSIADGTIIGAGTLVSRSLPEADFYTGVFPMMRNRDWERNAALVRHLVELRDRIRRLESRPGGPAAGGAADSAATQGDDAGAGAPAHGSARDE
jgi:UDP-3-O-[3-hydroxymyristoyl] glucosamine N-acyltransferase